jgi:hypothetical protein
VELGSVDSVPVEGMSYNSFLDYATSIGMSENVVDVKATFDRYKDPASNRLTENTFNEKLKCKTDIFLTHNWGVDDLGRQNHDRVVVINEALKSLGFVTWFDNDRMTGDVVY